MKRKIKIMSLNIGNPSIDRAKIQAEWIKNRSEDIFVLTETKYSTGCKYLEEYFEYYNGDIFTFQQNVSYHVHFPKSKTNDLGVMIISKYPISVEESMFNELSIYFARYLSVDIEFEKEKINVIGMYVPSRDRSDDKIERKKKFIYETMKAFKQGTDKKRIICGDLNILERNHYPKYNTYFEWEYEYYDNFIRNHYIDAFRYFHPKENEYSWVGRTNDGYRYDHCFVSDNMKLDIVDCYYCHETRIKGLTDHSAIVVEIEMM